MKFNRKKIFAAIVLLMSVLLCFDICFQENSNTSLIECSAEDTLHSDTIDFDNEVNEEHQIVFVMEFSSMVGHLTDHNHFYFSKGLQKPFFSVWQPPKLS
ncbi:hypothetical protein MW871_05460 [Flavobacterium sp. I-SCBP12n]|uniref:Uncharacterized protein n=1 Tax=Flavobacterium pygoscelis TaxID=2893176 RepID=A0A9X1XPS4_9FLAO|nr:MULTISPECIES: hypothetical protein [Flavobacterium]MCK8141335.1 hypothetical protein [Flavobacterium pygoscelis]